ncbi:MAG: hypothetical protein JSU77_03455 [Fidelibacterota bacterium]|nr:MAG: hypothetical protein JSU77_03455 [Candidatus Neomarinimicrobiota bacterium]
MKICLVKFPVLFLSLFMLVEVNHATIMKRMSIGELTRSSGIIAIGKVVTVESAWNTEHTMIFTNVEVSIDSALKGSDQRDNITFTLSGGIVGNIETVLIGSPRFNVGENTLLFLGNMDIIPAYNSLSVIGLSQGKFNIVTDPGTNSKMAVRHTSDIHFIGENNGAAPEDRIELQELIQFIRAELEGEE